MSTERRKILQAAFTLVVAAAMIFAITIVIAGRYGPVEAADDCQRYADAAEKELTRSTAGVGASIWELSNGRAKAWALLYIGCRRGQ